MKARIAGLSLLVLLVMVSSSWACMRYRDVIQDTAGNAINGVQVTVKNQNGTTATIYSDANCTMVTANPFTNNTDGTFAVYAKNGRYNLVLSKDSIGWSDSQDVLFLDAQDVLPNPLTVQGLIWSQSGGIKFPDNTIQTTAGGGGGGGAPVDAGYWVDQANVTLTAERNLGALTTGLVLNTVTSGVGVPSAYAGTSCTNQFPRSLSASGAATCASVSLTADVSGNLPVANLNSGTGASSTTYWRGDGIWATPAGSGSGITSINTSVTGPAVTFTPTTSGTDFTVSTSGSTTVNLNLPDAGASARGVVSTGNQAFSGIKTIPGIVVNGTPAIGIDLSTGTFSSFSLKDIVGDSVYFSYSWPGTAWELARGTTGSPVTTGGPLLKISKTQSILPAACNSVNLNGECSYAVVVNVKSTQTGGSELVGALHLTSETAAVGSGLGDADTLVSIGRSVGSSDAYGQGGYLEGFSSSSGVKHAMGAEIRVNNGGASDCIGDTWTTAIPAHCVSLLLSSSGAHNADMALQVAPIDGTLFTTGIGFNNGSIKSTGTTIRDSSNAAISYSINGGTHTTGIYFGTGTFSNGIDFGAATYSNTPILFGPSFQGGGDRVLCVSNSGGLWRGNTSSSCGPGGGGGGGITSINTNVTGPNVQFNPGTSGTDFNIGTSGTTTVIFNIPDASASARGLVTTGAQTFGGVKTIPGIIINGSPSVGVDLTAATFSSGTFGIKGPDIHQAIRMQPSGWAPSPLEYATYFASTVTNFYHGSAANITTGCGGCVSDPAPVGDPNQELTSFHFTRADASPAGVITANTLTSTFYASPTTNSGVGFGLAGNFVGINYRTNGGAVVAMYGIGSPLSTAASSSLSIGVMGEGQPHSTSSTGKAVGGVFTSAPMKADPPASYSRNDFVPGTNTTNAAIALAVLPNSAYYNPTAGIVVGASDWRSSTLPFKTGVYVENATAAGVKIAGSPSYLLDLYGASPGVAAIRFPDGTIQVTAGGGGGISGSGTANYLTQWTGTTSVGNSVLLTSSSAVGVDAKGMTVTNGVFKTAFGWIEPGSYQTDYETTTYAYPAQGPNGMTLYLTNKAQTQKEGIVINLVANGSPMHATGIQITTYQSTDTGAESSGIWIDQRGGGNGVAIYKHCNSTDLAGYYSSQGISPDCTHGVAAEIASDNTGLATVSSSVNSPAFLGRLAYFTGTGQAGRDSTINGLVGIRIQPGQAIAPYAGPPPGNYRAWSASLDPTLGNYINAETSYITMDGQAYFSTSLGVGYAGAPMQLAVQGAGQQTNAVNVLNGAGGAALLLQASGGAVYDGGMLVIGSAGQRWAAIKGLLQDGTTYGRGDLIFSTRRGAGDVNLTETLRITFDGKVRFPGKESVSGTRYACFNTSGDIVSQASPCSGT